MSCTTIRQRLLAAEQPDRPSTAETRHLAGCPACRAWLARLVKLEQQLPLLPVPPSTPPAALFARILEAAPAAPLVLPPARLYSSPHPRREGGRQKLALALALAAALALFAVGWWAVPHTPTAAPETADARMRKTQQMITKRLQRAATPPERVAVLADLANDFLIEARRHPEDPARVEELAGHFRRVVQEKLKHEADKVSFGERKTVLIPVANRLRKTGKEAFQLAGQWQNRHPVSAEALRQMAADADKADEQLQRLARTPV
jgi:hypothetical protein